MVYLYSITINGFVFVFYRLLSGMYLSTVIISKGFSSSRMDSVNVIERLVELLPFIAEPRRLWLPGSEQSSQSTIGNFKDGWSEKKRFGVISQPR